MKKQIGFTVDTKLLAGVRGLAESLGVTVSDLVNLYFANLLASDSIEIKLPSRKEKKTKTKTRKPISPFKKDITIV